MIRVLIERTLAAGAEEQLQEAMRQIRREAIHRPGYLSGETLRDVSNPRHYVILSTWRSREEWEAWKSSETRRAVEDKIAPMLEGPERITIFEPV